LQLGDGFLDALRRSSIDGNARAAIRQALGDGQSNALRRAGDESGLSGQINIHALLLPPGGTKYSDYSTSAYSSSPPTAISRSSRFKIFPVGLRGSSSRKTTSRGTL
jgi:hypothetical protein